MKGYIVVVAPSEHVWGGLEGLPDFVHVDLSDVDPEAVLEWQEGWQQNLDWEVVSSTLATDTHRLVIWTTNRRARDALGDITLADATEFLQRWSATGIVGGTTAGGATGVRFDITVLGAASSVGFWERDLTGFTFSELNYQQATGTHNLRLVYPTGLVHAAVLAEVGAKALVVADNAGPRRVDFRITRAEMLDAFKASIKQALQGVIQRWRRYFDPAAVDQVIAAGGTMTVTAAQALNNVRDAIND